MEHPFINDLSDKNVEELQETIISLTNKLSIAYRTQNQPLVNQLQMALESYKNAHNKKLDELFSKQNLDVAIKVDNKR